MVTKAVFISLAAKACDLDEVLHILFGVKPPAADLERCRPATYAAPVGDVSAVDPGVVVDRPSG
jgi:hypothetical protein